MMKKKVFVVYVCATLQLPSSREQTGPDETDLDLCRGSACVFGGFYTEVLALKRAQGRELKGRRE